VYCPGSEWLYIRLAVQPVFQDALLLRMWNELIAPLQNNRSIDGAFYVRYSDQQGQHLRVRIHAASAAGRAAMILACNQWLDQEADKGTCAVTRMETYAPEWNRYGGVASMAHVHTIFVASTVLAVSVIAVKEKKVQLALWSVDATLTALGLSSPHQKLEFARKHARGFANEYEMTPTIRKQVADLANQAGDLVALRLQFSDVARLNSAIGEVTRAGAALADLATLDQLCTPLADIHSSVLHMHLNRLFAENPRAQEAVFWDVLRRIYERHCALNAA
jgi:lantibiotic biosynthesis protein